MKIIDCEQRSEEWFAARLGHPTASSFGEIISPNGKPRTGVGPRKYMLSLLGERLTRQPARGFETPAMVRGTELEAAALAWYEFTTGHEVREVGFIMDDECRWGCSPDGLVGNSHGVEIKCPMVPNFLDYAESGEMPDAHFLQVQACLWITGIPRWDYVVWTDVDGLSPIVRECNPDSKIHAAFSSILPVFCDGLDEAERKMRKAGHGLNIRKENIGG